MYFGSTPINVVLNVKEDGTLHLRFNPFYSTPKFRDVLTEHSFNLLLASDEIAGGFPLNTMI